MMKAQTIRQAKQVRSEVTHDQIVQAAFACIRDQGFAKTTMDMVAAKAGCTRGAVVYHFGSNKTALTLSVAAMLSQRLLEIDLTESTVGKTRHDRLAVALQRAAEIYLGEEALVLLDIWIGCRADEEMRVQLAQMVSEMNEKVVARWLAAANLSVLTAEEAAYRTLFRAAMRGLMVEQILHGPTPAAEDSLALLFQLGETIFRQDAAVVEQTRRSKR